jgi:hypothetical protein
MAKWKQDGGGLTGEELAGVGREWVDRLDPLVRVGDEPGVEAWRRDFPALCVELGADPVEAIRAAALVKMEGLNDD